VGARDVERIEQSRRVGGHLLVAERPGDVWGATVALQLDGYHVEVAR
jgi:hypothetical protein